MCSRYLPAKTILFEQDRRGVTYRIPALLYLPTTGTLLAFAEERFTPNDADANLLVLRRGHLSGSYVEVRLNPNCTHPPTWVAFSHPTSPASRADLGVYLSTCPRDPDSWTEPWVISEGPSAYSDLAYLEAPSGEAGAPAAAIGCLYECGDRAAHERIAFSLFTVRELLRNVSDAAQRSPSPPSPSRSAKGERSCCGVA
eukprot:gi/632935117/ref/XP_007887895.1/ PREDICTED: sialidase-4 [Callorhinchus milii]